VGGATCTFQQAAAQAGQPDAAPFDLLCHLAFHAPVLTRRQRADRVKKQQAAMFNYLRPEARKILDLLLDKHDITAIEMNPATIVDAFNREAAHAMRLKKLEL
jgi:hypothetical protein